MRNEQTASGAQVPCISLLAASVAIKDYLESPACAIPGFDIPDAIWMPFAYAVEAEDEKANPSRLGTTAMNNHKTEETSNE